MKNLTTTMVALVSLMVVVSATATPPADPGATTTESTATATATATTGTTPAVPCTGPRRMSDRSVKMCEATGGELIKNGDVPIGCTCPDDRDYNGDGKTDDADEGAFDWWFGCRDVALVTARNDASRQSKASAEATVRFEGLFAEQKLRDAGQDEIIEGHTAMFEMLVGNSDDPADNGRIGALENNVDGNTTVLVGNGQPTEVLLDTATRGGVVMIARDNTERHNTELGDPTDPTNNGLVGIEIARLDNRIDHIRQAYFRIMLGFTGSFMSTPVITWSDDSDEMVRGIFSPMLNVGIMVGSIDKIGAGAAGTADLQIGPGMSTDDESGVELAIRLGGNALLPMVGGWKFAPGAFFMIQSTDTQMGNPNGSRAASFLAGGSVAIMSPDQMPVTAHRIPSFFARLDVGGGGVHYDVVNLMDTPDDTSDDESVSEDKGAFGATFTVGVAF